MSFQVVTFITYESALAASWKVWRNYLVQAQNNGAEIVFNNSTPLTGTVSDIEDVSVLELLPTYGDSDYRTIKYTNIQKAFNVDVWFFPVPENESFLDGVTDYIIQEYDNSWDSPEE